MTAITLIVTNAGRAALVDAANAGTNAVTIASAGLTATSFAPLATQTALPGEFKRIAGIGGATVDPDTISLIVRDETTDVYTLRGFGLFLSNGTLFAIYGQATPILDKSANSTALLAVDVRFADINAANLVFGNANFTNPPATTTVQGVLELATNAEAQAGTDTVRGIVPSALKFVLDSRFGANSASAFVKTLLTAATAAAFRLVLEVKSAALKDEGPGNGLNADLLDGFHAASGGSLGPPWPAIPVIGSTGVLEIGQAIDFHATSVQAVDSVVRISLSGSDLLVNGGRMWHVANDGAGSGLDADLLDGQDGAFYTNIPARLGYTPYNLAAVPTGFGITQSGIAVSQTDPENLLIGASVFTNSVNNGYSGNVIAYVVALGGGDVLNRGLLLSSHFASGDLMMRSRPGAWTRVWTAGNDGSGSGLDADLLDGQDSGFYTNIPARLGYTPYPNSNPAGFLNNISGALVTAALGYTPWHPGNDGSGSGLDADLLDGRDSGSFANASHQHGPADLAPAFANRSLTTDGWQVLPGGLILQWGRTRQFQNQEVPVTIAFPIPFPNACLNITGTAHLNATSTGRDHFVQTIGNPTTTNATFMLQSSVNASSDGINWFAIGH